VFGEEPSSSPRNRLARSGFRAARCTRLDSRHGFAVKGTTEMPPNPHTGQSMQFSPEVISVVPGPMFSIGPSTEAKPPGLWLVVP
jgi:hypothetical protein